MLASVALLCAGALRPAAAQNLLPNPGFEDGTNAPAGWRLSDAKLGAWSPSAHQGRHALAVSGAGKESSSWRVERVPLTPGGVYRLRFWGRHDANTSGGCAVTGTGRVNRDFRFSEQWQPYSYIFSAPSEGITDFVRLGQWETKGNLFFDDAELLPVKVTHLQCAGGVELGEGERIEKGTYQFCPNFGWQGANFHRPLSVNRATFNSDRWCFAAGAEVVWRFALPGLKQTSAHVRVGVGYYVAGALRIDASRDGRAWTAVANCDGKQRSTNAALPDALFPASEVFVRLSTPDKPSNLQVNALDYDAALDQPVADAEGQTWFLAVQQSAPDVGAWLQSVTPNAGPGSMNVQLWLTNRSARALNTSASLTATPGAGTLFPPQPVQPGAAGRWDMAARVVQPGAVTLEARFADETGRALFAGTIDAARSFLLDPRPGHPLKDDLLHGAWWCEAGWKIGRDAQPPVSAGAPSPAVAVSAARGEYEAAQLILPPRAATLRSAQATPLRRQPGEISPITVTLNEVAYVQVARPTDGTCERGWYPDPLPPLRTPRHFDGRNLPLWLTFHVAREAQPGDYAGELELVFDTGTLRVPLAVHVHDFALPRETHLRSGFGLGRSEINRYHRLTNQTDKVAVYESYLKNFADHRISPYSFFDYAPIDIKFTGQGTNKQAKVDFTQFDAAAVKWLDGAKFTGYRLPLRGMGGGTFQSRSLGALEGFKEGTPEFARLFADYLGQVTEHLRAHGWLDQAYTYWFDEPDRKDYAFVVEGMKRIKAAAPSLRRMLTEQPEPELLDHVDIWCGLTPEWTREKVAARRAAGQEVWWYICCGPHAPYITEFIDHPGTELRLWPWQSWQYGVQGILVWASTYWSSSSAFPNTLQDPWADPMSYVSDATFTPGQLGYWGNGDGRFLYPPRRDPNAPAAPCLDAPISSVRWENLRDGMEDYEYFWLLDQQVKRLGALHREKSKGETEQLLREAKGLLAVPEEISKDTTHFTTDPRLMLAHRDRVAKMIEKLQALP